MKIVLSTLILFMLFSCSERKIQDLDFLIGTWQIEGQEQYEFWEASESEGLIGYSYQWIDDKKEVWENLSIKEEGQEIVYRAEVQNQNNGEGILFILNTEIDSCFSFENAEHDFPKKIQYQRISNDSIRVAVLGDTAKDFSYLQIKQTK